MKVGGDQWSKNRGIQHVDSTLRGGTWVTTDRRHKQWWAISGQRRVGNGGNTQGGAGNALDETHSHTEDEWKHREGPPR